MCIALPGLASNPAQMRRGAGIAALTILALVPFELILGAKSGQVPNVPTPRWNEDQEEQDRARTAQRTEWKNTGNLQHARHYQKEKEPNAASREPFPPQPPLCGRS